MPQRDHLIDDAELLELGAGVGCEILPSVRRDRAGMFRLFLSSLFLSSRLWLGVVVSPLREGRSLLGALLITVGWPVFMVLQVLHWTGFALDEILFPGWKKVQVRKPVFVLGPPRSGTTHLHHVLASDPSTTTFRLWECLFGLSVSARRLLLLLGAVDRRIGRPLARLGGFLDARLGAGMSDVHPLALDAPEEDFLTLLPAMQCFILIAVFPNADWLWRTARLDREVAVDERARLMHFYAACVKKHLYVHGSDKRFLSKNASFSGSPESLLAVFPDACFFACHRDPVETVPSQLSSIEPALRLAGFDGVPVAVRDRLIELLVFYYGHLTTVGESRPEQWVQVSNHDLHQRLAETVRAGYARLGLPIQPPFEQALSTADRQSRSFRSGHRYSPADYGLTSEGIRRRFADVDPMPAAGASNE
ncbi:MAG: sulfotransferase [Wenzhouxiangella sp.]|jgi:hypothetical protein|nr:sulfotransferase [Wenzhouxiangella sp.]